MKFIHFGNALREIMLNSREIIPKHLLQLKISSQSMFSFISLSSCFFLSRSLSMDSQLLNCEGQEIEKYDSTLTNVEEISASCTEIEKRKKTLTNAEVISASCTEIEKRKKRSQEPKYRFMRFFFGHICSCTFLSFGLIMLCNFYLLSGCIWGFASYVSHLYGSEHLNPEDQDWMSLEKEKEKK